MIATISPSSQNYEHSANTLRYAFRVQGLTLANISPSKARNAPRLTVRGVQEVNNGNNKHKNININTNKQNEKIREGIELPMMTDTDSKQIALCTGRKTDSPARLVRRCKSKAKRNSINNDKEGEDISEPNSQVIAINSTPLLTAEQNKRQENK